MFLNFHKSLAHPGLYLSVMPPPQIVFHFQLSRVVGVDIFYFIFTKGIFHLISSTVPCSVLLLPGKAHSWILDVPSHHLQWHSCHGINIPQWTDPSNFSSSVTGWHITALTWIPAGDEAGYWSPHLAVTLTQCVVQLYKLYSIGSDG